MSTLQGRRPPEGQDDHSHRDGGDVMRTTMLMSGGAVGAILAITLLSALKDIGPVATAAITAISAIAGAAIGVAALEIRRRSK